MSAPTIASIAISLVICVMFGAWCGHIAKRKNLNVIGYALLGFLLPMIGLVVVVVEPPVTRPVCATCGRS